MSGPQHPAQSPSYDEILRSTVRLARLSFSAAAASVFLRDEDQGLLVFEASSGVGEDRLVGTAIPAGQGIAGWVAATGETVIVRGVADDDRFDRDFALSTGLVPDVLMAVPMEHAGEIIGVLEVLDPKTDGVGDLDAMDLLSELAHQSTAALALLLSHRRTARTGLTGDAGSATGAGTDAGRATVSRPTAEPLDRIRSALAGATGRRADAGHALLAALADLLDPAAGPPPGPTPDPTPGPTPGPTPDPETGRAP
ncbi:GAF domain-containing protein [Streptomyces sp. NPDC087270]|uniref:GAF domain-containing protein n=1 Tax=Streptomyces sp. NPDC087270 TaxID=3365774 RepID=UPI00382DDFC6